LQTEYFIQGGSNMTRTDLYKRTHKSVPLIFKPPCIIEIKVKWLYSHNALQCRISSTIRLPTCSELVSQSRCFVKMH